jgi:hypothetical protein
MHTALPDSALARANNCEKEAIMTTKTKAVKLSSALTVADQIKALLDLPLLEREAFAAAQWDAHGAAVTKAQADGEQVKTTSWAMVCIHSLAGLTSVGILSKMRTTVCKATITANTSTVNKGAAMGISPLRADKTLWAKGAFGRMLEAKELGIDIGGLTEKEAQAKLSAAKKSAKGETDESSRTAPDGSIEQARETVFSAIAHMDAEPQEFGDMEKALSDVLAKIRAAKKEQKAA